MKGKYLPKFGFYHTGFPFKEPIYQDKGFSGYKEFEEYLNRIPRDLYRRCIKWAEDFENEFRETGDGKFKFSSQENREKINQEYFYLVKKLTEEGFEFSFDMWW
ncbi:hypothetical protein [Rothia sp. ZJ932]|uniref:hypothetical protein n=1 Tax=Rothia sp. ZJ932 TaxID=2810516 RepID=UPI001966F19F|nr:hypothetical protein [Rothia sp. ZJ932]QRZ60972.1 hypothetical protein JR346_06810 [Rothia sp. ZJ932]